MTHLKLCSVKNCSRAASFEVILYDVYIQEADVFFEPDTTCPYLCEEHMAENELSIRGERKPRNLCAYKFTNQLGAQGFTIYKPLT